MSVILQCTFVLAVVGVLGLLFWAVGGVGMGAVGLGDKHDANADTMYSNN
jgi:hypothetical protein